MHRSREPLPSPLPDVPWERIPRHIAIIMDGNGRWAQARGLPRSEGHRAGAKSVRAVITACKPLGVRFMTLYSFSAENWTRPKEEIDALMELCVLYCRAERDSLVAEGIRVRWIGDREGLPSPVRDALEDVEQATAHVTGPTLVLAINYAGRSEIVRAARLLAQDVESGLVCSSEIDERMVASRLFAPDIPDPDLLVRTAGEMRVSNFLLWQISYAEIHVTRTLWPDFAESDLHTAIRDYACRQRKFGGLPDPLASSRREPC
ncbi:MAG: di-trans,poly-cis-decaprenylcistransferase [Phycisphaeraceae bacterium]|nr:di-trans,poly-cis-decaprenylcistransferase [Phycisphaeraceae bacterium]